MIRVLAMQMFDNAWLGPFEVLVFITCDQPGLLPFVVAGHVFVDGEQQIEPAAEKQKAIGTDRVRLQSPRFYAIGGPDSDR